MPTGRRPGREPTEAEMLKTCMSILAAFGWRVFRRNTGAMTATYNGKRRYVRFAEKGQADLYGWIPGAGGGPATPFECEVKRPGRRPRPDQLDWLMRCSRDGVVAFWVSDADACLEIASCVSAGGSIVWIGDAGFSIVHKS